MIHQKRYTRPPTTVRVATRLTPDERERVYEAAKLQGIAQAAMMRAAICEHAERILAARRG